MLPYCTRKGEPFVVPQKAANLPLLLTALQQNHNWHGYNDATAQAKLGLQVLTT